MAYDLQTQIGTAQDTGPLPPLARVHTAYNSLLSRKVVVYQGRRQRFQIFILSK